MAPKKPNGPAAANENLGGEETQAGATANLSKVLKQNHHTRTETLFAIAPEENPEDTVTFAHYFATLEEMSATDKNFILAHVLSIIALLISPGTRLLS